MAAVVHLRAEAAPPAGGRRSPGAPTTRRARAPSVGAMKTTTLLAATAASAALAVPVLSSAGDAQAPTPQHSVQEFMRAVTDGGFLDAPPRHKQSPGDALVESSRLRDAASKTVGRAIDHCILVDHRGTLTCTGVVLLRDGSLTFAGRTGMDGKPSAFAVTGGTGAYAGGGWIDDQPTSDDHAKSTLNLLATP